MICHDASHFSTVFLEIHCFSRCLCLEVFVKTLKMSSLMEYFQAKEMRHLTSSGMPW